MKSTPQSIVLNDIDLFRLKTNTILKIRVNDPPSSRYKSIELKRQAGDKVKILYRDFAGSTFRVEISLSTKMANLVSPDLSPFGVEQVGTVVVLKDIQEMLSGLS